MAGTPELYTGEAINPKHLSPFEMFFFGWHRNYKRDPKLVYKNPCSSEDEDPCCEVRCCCTCNLTPPQHSTLHSTQHSTPSLRLLPPPPLTPLSYLPIPSTPIPPHPIPGLRLPRLPQLRLRRVLHHAAAGRVRARGRHRAAEEGGARDVASAQLRHTCTNGRPRHPGLIGWCG